MMSGVTLKTKNMLLKQHFEIQNFKWDKIDVARLSLVVGWLVGCLGFMAYQPLLVI